MPRIKKQPDGSKRLTKKMMKEFGFIPYHGRFQTISHWSNHGSDITFQEIPTYDEFIQRIYDKAFYKGSESIRDGFKLLMGISD